MSEEMAKMTTEQRAEAWVRLMEMLRERIKEAKSVCGRTMSDADFRWRFGKAAYDAMVLECNAMEFETLDEVLYDMAVGLMLELTGYEGDYVPER